MVEYCLIVSGESLPNRKLSQATFTILPHKLAPLFPPNAISPDLLTEFPGGAKPHFIFLIADLKGYENKGPHPTYILAACLAQLSSSVRRIRPCSLVPHQLFLRRLSIVLCTKVKVLQQLWQGFWWPIINKDL